MQQRNLREIGWGRRRRVRANEGGARERHHAFLEQRHGNGAREPASAEPDRDVDLVDVEIRRVARRLEA